MKSRGQGDFVVPGTVHYTGGPRRKQNKPVCGPRREGPDPMASLMAAEEDAQVIVTIPGPWEGFLDDADNPFELESRVGDRQGLGSRM